MVRVEVRFRSAREISFAPERVCAPVGEASAGKSNILTAIRALLDAGAPSIERDDLTIGGDGRVTTSTGVRPSLACLIQPPFTIAVSGFDAQARVLWQAGLAELSLRASPEVEDAPLADPGGAVSDRRLRKLARRRLPALPRVLIPGKRRRKQSLRERLRTLLRS